MARKKERKYSFDPNAIILNLHKQDHHHREGKREGVISCDILTDCGRRSSLEFIRESMHFNKADSYVGFYVLFILWGFLLWLDQ